MPRQCPNPVQFNFQFPVGIRWCSDYYYSLEEIWEEIQDFQFPVGIRWCSDLDYSVASMAVKKPFNSLWELDGVRTGRVFPAERRGKNFQFPVGIRWCSDEQVSLFAGWPEIAFQFPVGIRWCSDGYIIASCSPHLTTFNSLWELDGVRTSGYITSNR